MNEWGKWCQLYLNKIEQQMINAIWGQTEKHEQCILNLTFLAYQLRIEEA